MTEFIKGGSFLISEIEANQIFTPNEFTDIQKQIIDLVSRFINNDVLPNSEEIENQNWSVTINLLKKAGELGLLSFDIPEEYGGMGLDKTTSIIVTEQISKHGSFAVSYGTHTGIGTLPIVFFGTEKQKEKYLPKFALGDLLSAYALTEANSGSDALAIQTKAILSDDAKHYILNGTKMWITNAGFADVFITFAKVDGDKFTAFIVEKDFEGVSLGHEEKKLGIKGSSTRAVIFDNAKVPVENVLGEIGKGHKIAFNILNIGRFKLAAGSLGEAKAVIPMAIKYSKERHQFGKSLSEFGLIQQKIADMIIKAYACESMTYRTSGLIDNYKSVDTLKAIEEYAIECSIMKIYGSEMLDFVVDEALQIFGGYGYSQEYPIEKFYRDSRINRIFEGTNEINRMLITSMLMKKIIKNELPLIEESKNIMDEILSFPSLEEDDDTLFSVERKIIKNAKKIFLLVAGTAVEKYMNKLSEQQEITAYISDLIIEIYAMESTILRTLKLAEINGKEKVKIQINISKVLVNDSIAKIDILAKNILASVSETDTLKTLLTALKRFTKYTPINTIKLRREIANNIIFIGDYNL